MTMGDFIAWLTLVLFMGGIVFVAVGGEQWLDRRRAERVERRRRTPSSRFERARSANVTPLHTAPPEPKENHQ